MDHLYGEPHTARSYWDAERRDVVDNRRLVRIWHPETGTPMDGYISLWPSRGSSDSLEFTSLDAPTTLHEFSQSDTIVGVHSDKCMMSPPVEPQRVFLVKPGDSIVFGNIGDMDAEGLQNLHAVSAALKDRLKLHTVFFCPMDIDMELIDAAIHEQAEKEARKEIANPVQMVNIDVEENSDGQAEGTPEHYGPEGDATDADR